MTRLVPKPLAMLIEEARVATLERYRDLPAASRAGLCRVSSAAAEGLGATQAAISFVDRSRIWFGGAFGFDRSETARLSSFCDAVVRSGEAMVVPDGRADPRFRDHEMVRAEPGLRSYAGVPLIEGGGYTLGTVAVYSAAPNSFSAAVLTELADLATLVRDFLNGHGAAPAQLRPIPAPARRVQGWLGVRMVGNGKGRPVGAGAGWIEGLLVVSVARRSPAADAGLRPTDVLHSIDGQVLTAVPDVAAALANRVNGSNVPVRFRRAGQWHECLVPIRARKCSPPV